MVVAGAAFVAGLGLVAYLKDRSDDPGVTTEVALLLTYLVGVLSAHSVGLAAGRNTEPFLLQTYRRDMGGGQFVLMKDISAPIVVDGRHWGGLRLAIRV